MHVDGRFQPRAGGEDATHEPVVPAERVEERRQQGEGDEHGSGEARHPDLEDVDEGVVDGAGAMALVGAGLFFAPHYLLGLAQSWEIALFAVGIILLAVEVFVTPGFGVFGIAGVVATLGALLIALVPNIGFQFPSDGEIAQATTTLAATLVLLVVLAVSLGRYLPRSERFSRLILADELSAVTGHTSADTDETLLGLRGRAITALRPSGTADLNGRRVDVVATGQFVDAGTDVEVVSVRGSVVEVRPVSAA